MVQAKLKLGAPGDAFEQEADRVAEQVMRMPAPGKCSACAAAEAAGRPAPCPACAAKDAENSVRRKADGGGGESTLGTATAAKISGLRGGGAPLPAADRAYFEPRFGTSFETVRIHTGSDAAEAAESIRAKAFTHGHDVAFGRGQYAPETADGRRLLAHELTHVLQQGAAPATRASPVQRHTAPQVQGDWVIDNHTRQTPAGGTSDGQLIEDAFTEICPLTTRTNDRITMAAGPPSPNRTGGCGCLSTIEADLASTTPILQGTPRIGLTVDGWSSANASASPPTVNARHPSGSFEWGYWTGGQTRSLKPFFRTVAHEVCGHVATFVTSGGAHAGGRGSPTGHNEAIEGENRIATEHGVAAADLRGLDRDPAGNPLAGHRGESFLQATVSGFAHGSDSTTPTNVASVVTGAVDTIATVQTHPGLNLMVQVEGFALSNEGQSIAIQRVDAVRTLLAAAINARSGLVAPAAGRFQTDLDTVLPGQSTAGTSNPGRRVQVYLFHQVHSAGP